MCCSVGIIPRHSMLQLSESPHCTAASSTNCAWLQGFILQACCEHRLLSLPLLSPLSGHELYMPSSQSELVCCWPPAHGPIEEWLLLAALASVSDPKKRSQNRKYWTLLQGKQLRQRRNCALHLRRPRGLHNQRMKVILGLKQETRE